MNLREYKGLCFPIFVQRENRGNLIMDMLRANLGVSARSKAGA